MTLADKIFEQRTGIEVAPGFSHDALLRPIAQRISKAQVFILDQDVVTMAANVSLSKPTSIYASLPWLRLPFENTWVEFSPEDLSVAMASLGSPNLQASDAVGRLKKVGFLLRMRGTTLVFDLVHDMMTEGIGQFVDVSSVRGLFDLADIGELGPVNLDRTVHSDAKGRVRQHMQLISKDPKEAAAQAEIARRFDWEYNPDTAPAAAAIARHRGQELVDQVHAGWVGEMTRLFTMGLLPGLLLINTKNAIGIEPGPDLSKLNKARLKKHRHPLVEHKIVKLKLTAAQQRQSRESGDGGRIARGGIVVGHFKARQTGIFWWHPHARRGFGAITKTIMVTR